MSKIQQEFDAIKTKITGVDIVNGGHLIGRTVTCSNDVMCGACLRIDKDMQASIISYDEMHAAFYGGVKGLGIANHFASAGEPITALILSLPNRVVPAIEDSDMVAEKAINNRYICSCFSPSSSICMKHGAVG